jgi:hypothetical protein
VVIVDFQNENASQIDANIAVLTRKIGRNTCVNFSEEIRLDAQQQAAGPGTRGAT